MFQVNTLTFDARWRWPPPCSLPDLPSQDRDGGRDTSHWGTQRAWNMWSRDESIRIQAKSSGQTNRCINMSRQPLLSIDLPNNSPMNMLWRTGWWGWGQVDKQYVEAVKLHRCTACEDTAPRSKTHKTSLPYEHRFGSNLGLDLLAGRKYAVLNMVDLGTTFQILHVIRMGVNATGSQVLKALSQRWFSWASFPETLHYDRGLHNRGVLAQFCGANGVQVRHAPLETPEAIGRVERHGGIAKAMYRKVAAEVQPSGADPVDQVLAEVVLVKNNSIRHGGFSG